MVNTVNASPKPHKKPYTKTVIVVGLIILAFLAIKHAPTAAADPVTCQSDYYSSATWTSCSDGTSQVCYDGGSCTMTTADQRAAGRESRRGFYEDLLRGAGFCNVVECVK
ncbi:hypothetical protein [Mycolicibacterium vinylchloridicum]|uniref:hypothetical protein n=1 Tax=Mycolicibacterium vinylchloridicum TaxID=2736928 RepID=UPI0015CD190B|nr:hypothetical protein [Mycolicibacterium vinylchloridicum]